MEKKVEGASPEQQLDTATARKTADTALTSRKLKFCLFQGNNSSVFRNILLSRGCWEEIKEKSIDEKAIFSSAQFMWRSYNFSMRKYTVMDEIQRSAPFKQLINHFEDNNALCSKTGLVRSLNAYYRFHDQANSARYGAFDTMATSFILTAGQHDNEMGAFIKRFNQINADDYTKEKLPLKHCRQNMWLLKPADLNQGRGIEIVKSAVEMCASLNAKQQPASKWIVQKYIEKPLLYHQRKFDIRIWVLLTRQCDIFFYEKGYIRTCSDNYSMADDNPNLHLTNNYVQKKDKNYGAHEDGNTLPLERLFEYIDSLCKQNGYQTQGMGVKEKLVQRMKDLVIDTIMASRKQLLNAKRTTGFELFGYDFLIDEDLRLWLIEVNTNPYIGTPNQYIEELIPQMAEDLMQLTVDQMFPPTTLPQRDNKQNLFELIYCEAGSTFSSTPKNVRSSFFDSVYPIESLAQKPNKPIRVSMILPIKYKQNSVQPGVPKEIVGAKQLSSARDQVTPAAVASIISPQINIVAAQQKSDEKQINRIAEEQATIAQQSPHSYPLQSERRSIEKLDKNENAKKSQPPTEPPVELKPLADFEQLSYQLKKLLMTNPVNSNELSYLRQLVIQVLKRLPVSDTTDESSQRSILRSLRQFVQSKFLHFLIDEELIIQFQNILDNAQSTDEPKQIVFSALHYLSKSSGPSKVRLATTPIILALVKSSTNIFIDDASESKKQNAELAIESLIQLLGIYNRRMYIPGETSVNEKIRKLTIENGGLLILLYVKSKMQALNISANNQRAIKECIDCMELSDLDYQMHVVQSSSKSSPANEQSVDQHIRDYGADIFNGCVTLATQLQQQLSDFDRMRRDQEKSRRLVEQMKDQQLETEKQQKIIERRAVFLEFQRKKNVYKSTPAKQVSQPAVVLKDSDTQQVLAPPSIEPLPSALPSPVLSSTPQTQPAKTEKSTSTRLLSQKQLLSMSHSQMTATKLFYSPLNTSMIQPSRLSMLSPQKPSIFTQSQVSSMAQSQGPSSNQAMIFTPSSPQHVSPLPLDLKSKKKLPSIHLTYEKYISLKKKQLEKKSILTPIFPVLDQLNSSQYSYARNKPLRLKPIRQFAANTTSNNINNNSINDDTINQPSELPIREEAEIIELDDNDNKQQVQSSGNDE